MKPKPVAPPVKKNYMAFLAVLSGMKVQKNGFVKVTLKAVSPGFAKNAILNDTVEIRLLM